MLLEGTSLYFWLIFLIIVLIYITKKVSLTSIFKKARIKSTKALIPIKYRIDLVDALHLNRNIAYMAYIPFYGFKYRKIILETLLQGFGLDPKDYLSFFLFPMYKYPELAFRNVKLIQNDYSLTETFLESEQILAGKNEVKEMKQEPPINQDIANISPTISNDISYQPNMINVDSQNNISNQKDQIEHYINQDIYNQNNSVFTNQNLIPDERKETYVKVEKERPKEQKSIITPLSNGNEKVCPNCGAKLSPDATICFLCGHHLN